MVIANKNHVSRGILLFEFRVCKSAAIIAEGLAEIADILPAANAAPPPYFAVPGLRKRFP
jgi:hypothetical protein